MPPSAGRLRCLQALAFGALGLTPDLKAELVDRICPGKAGFPALTNIEADQLIDHMKRLAGQTPMRPQGRERRHVRRGAASGDVTPLVTPAQRERLAELRRALLAAGLTPSYPDGVCRRACGREQPMTSFECEKAIEALKALA